MPPKKKIPENLVQIYPTPRFVPGMGPSTAKIAIVGEAPGKEEDNSGKPFMGSAGQLLNRLLREAGLNRDDCYITNIVKYRPPANNLKLLAQVGVDFDNQVAKTKYELEILKPNLILALGNTALSALTTKKGIAKYRGSILTSNFCNFKVIPTYHPAALLYQKERDKKSQAPEAEYDSMVGGETLVIADLIKAKRESEYPEISRLEQKTDIIRDSYSLFKFLDSYSNYHEVALDIETNHGIPICLGLAFTQYHAASIPLLPISDYTGGIILTSAEYISIWKMLFEFLNRTDIKFIVQNGKFDLEKLRAPGKLLNCQPGKIAADTSLMMGIAYTEFPKNLGFMTSLFTNMPYYKDEGKDFNPKKDKAEKLLEYNGKDCMATVWIKKSLDSELADFGNLYNRDLRGFYYDYVNQLTDFYIDIENEGLDVDVDRRQILLGEYQQLIDGKHLELESLVGHEFNVRSNPSIRKLLIDELHLPARPNYQEETIVALLGNHTEKNSKESRILSLILEERQLRTNYNYLKANYDPDNRMRTTYRITGTETGRTSTGILKPPIRPFKSGLAFQTLPKHGPFSKKIRSIFIPPPGYVFVEADYSQAEARIVALLADDDVTLNLFNSTDIHRVTSSWIFGIEPDRITDDQRFIGKTARHAGNYGEGKRRLMLDVNANAKKFGIPIQISEAEAGKIIEVFHQRTPKIKKVFHAEIRTEVGKTRTLFNPFGRMRQFFGTVKDTETYAQIPQSTVPDMLRMAGLRIKKRVPEIRICLEAHDALLFKLPADNWQSYAKIIKEEMEQVVDFCRCSLPRGRLIIPAEIQVGDRYSELKKVKIA